MVRDDSNRVLSQRVGRPILFPASPLSAHGSILCLLVLAGVERPEERRGKRPPYHPRWPGRASHAVLAATRACAWLQRFNPESILFLGPRPARVQRGKGPRHWEEAPGSGAPRRRRWSCYIPCLPPGARGSWRACWKSSASDAPV